jgi:hypothetical protein
MTDRRSASHAGHDPLLISALAAGDLDQDDRTRAEGLAASCADCAVLLADLRSLAAAVAALPAPRRTRDFALRAEDARRLDQRGWRGVLAAFTGPRFTLRPLAAGLTTLGLAGLLLAAMPSLPLGGSPSSPLSTVGDSIDTAGQGAASAEPRDVAGAGAPSAAPSTELQFGPASADPIVRPGASANPVPSPKTVYDGGVGRTSTETESTDGTAGLPAGEPGGPSPLVVLSASLLAIGLFLFGIRWTARRFAAR